MAKRVTSGKVGRDFLDLSKQTFGHLVVKRYAGRNAAGLTCWYCDCDCGVKNVKVATKRLRRGETRSCGHLKRGQYPHGRHTHARVACGDVVYESIVRALRETGLTLGQMRYKLRTGKDGWRRVPPEQASEVSSLVAETRDKGHVESHSLYGSQTRKPVYNGKIYPTITGAARDANCSISSVKRWATLGLHGWRWQLDESAEEPDRAPAVVSAPEPELRPPPHGKGESMASHIISPDTGVLILNLAKQTFGELTVTRYAGKNASGKLCWYCDCACGKKDVKVSIQSLRRGSAKSCGHLHLAHLKQGPRKSVPIAHGKKVYKSLGQAAKETGSSPCTIRRRIREGVDDWRLVDPEQLSATRAPQVDDSFGGVLPEPDVSSDAVPVLTSDNVQEAPVPTHIVSLGTGKVLVNLVGKTYGELTVKRYGGWHLRDGNLWDCDCSCGATYVKVRSDQLMDGEVTTCGHDLLAATPQVEGAQTDQAADASLALVNELLADNGSSDQVVEDDRKGHVAQAVGPPSDYNPFDYKIAYKGKVYETIAAAARDAGRATATVRKWANLGLNHWGWQRVAQDAEPVTAPPPENTALTNGSVDPGPDVEEIASVVPEPQLKESVNAVPEPQLEAREFGELRKTFLRAAEARLLDLNARETDLVIRERDLAARELDLAIRLRNLEMRHRDLETRRRQIENRERALEALTEKTTRPKNWHDAVSQPQVVRTLILLEGMLRRLRDELGIK